jgi:hypothetical protein
MGTGWNVARVFKTELWALDTDSDVTKHEARGSFSQSTKQENLQHTVRVYTYDKSHICF